MKESCSCSSVPTVEAAEKETLSIQPSEGGFISAPEPTNLAEYLVAGKAALPLSQMEKEVGIAQKRVPSFFSSSFLREFAKKTVGWRKEGEKSCCGICPYPFPPFFPSFLWERGRERGRREGRLLTH